MLSLVTLFACDPNEKVKAPGLREAVENRKIKQIHEPEILERAKRMGEEFAVIAEKTLGKALKSTIQEKGVAEAIGFCNVNVFPLLRNLQDTNNIIIRRVSFKNRNPNNKPTEFEAQLLDAYHYNVENNIELTANVQKNGDDYYYVKPIFMQDLCLNCHGIPIENITAENFDKIRELYPEGKATGYKTGDLRGMWSIKIPKKEVVLAISDDTWKPKYEKKK